MNTSPFIQAENGASPSGSKTNANSSSANDLSEPDGRMPKKVRLELPLADTSSEAPCESTPDFDTTTVDSFEYPPYTWNGYRSILLIWVRIDPDKALQLESPEWEIAYSLAMTQEMFHADVLTVLSPQLTDSSATPERPQSSLSD